MLESMAAFLEIREMEIADQMDAMAKHHKRTHKRTPRGVLANRPPVQIHVHEDAATGKITVQTEAGTQSTYRSMRGRTFRPREEKLKPAIC
jgi:hypothetical protein